MFLLAVRMQWAKSYARATQWQEEVLILCEEMSRVAMSFIYEATKWRSCVIESSDGDMKFRDGRNAYAWEHSALYENLLANFQTRWRPVLKQAIIELRNTDGCTQLVNALSIPLHSPPNMSCLPAEDTDDVVAFDDCDDTTSDDDD